MRVQRVVMPVTNAESWTVLDYRLATVVPAEQFLAHLAAMERSPNTVRAYAYSLALWFEWLGLRGRVWDEADVEDVSEFVPMALATAAGIAAGLLTASAFVAALGGTYAPPLATIATAGLATGTAVVAATFPAVKRATSPHNLRST